MRSFTGPKPESSLLKTFLNGFKHSKSPLKLDKQQHAVVPLQQQALHPIVPIAPAFVLLNC